MLIRSWIRNFRQSLNIQLWAARAKHKGAVQSRYKSRRQRSRQLIEPLESRMLLTGPVSGFTAAATGIDLGGLRFQSSTGFAENNGHDTTTSPVQVGYTPSSGSFIPLMQLTGQVDIDTNALSFSATGAVSTTISGTSINLLSGGISTSISSIIGAGLPGLSGSSLTVAGTNFTLNSIALSNTNNSPEIQLQGAVSLLGMTLGVNGANHVNISSSGVDLTGLDATVKDGSLHLGSLTFTTSGLHVAYTDATSTINLTGTSSVAVTGMGTLSVGLGSGSTQGLVVQHGAVSSFDATLNGGFTVGGVSFNSAGDHLTYTSATDTWGLTGTSTVTFAGVDSLNMTFGDGTTPGLTIANGNLENLDLTVGSTFHVGGVTITADSLEFKYQNTSQTLSGSGTYTGTYNANQYVFGMFGTASIAFAGIDSLSVTFGHGATPGLIISNGNLESLDATVNASFKVAAVVVQANDLEFKYTNTSQTLNGGGTYTGTYNVNKYIFAMYGTASITFAGIDSLSVTLGHGATPGLVISNGILESLDVTVNSSFKVASVVVQANDLEFKYTNTSQTLSSGGTYTGTYNVNKYIFAMYGTASITFAGIDSLSVTFGHGATPGLVISNGNLESLDVTVNASFKVASVVVQANDLEFQYTNTSQTLTSGGTYTGTYNVNKYIFAMYGTASITFAGIDSLSVTFGHGATPGLVISNGNLESLDVTVNVSFKVAAVVVQANDLEFKYTNTSQTLTSGGTYTGTYNVNKYIFAMYGTASITFAGIDSLSVTFGHGATPGLIISNGNLESLDVTVNASFKVAAVVIQANDLEFKYTNTSQTFNATTQTYTGNYNVNRYIFAMYGTASITFAGIDSLSVTFGHGATPGLVISNGNLESLDVTVNASFKVAAVVVQAKDLEFKYTNTSQTFNPTSQTYTGNYNVNRYIFAMYGTAAITFAGIDSLSVTLGHGSTPGLVISNGNLENLDVTVNASFKVATVVIQANDLEFKYTNTSQTLVNGAYQGTYDSNKYLFSMSGSATVSIAFMANTTVKFGHDGVPGMVIQNGSLVSMDLEILSDIGIAGATLAKADLGLIYTASNDTYLLYGNDQVNLGFGQLQTTLGGGTRDAALSSPDTGVVITHGVLQHFNMTLNGSLGFGAITFANGTFSCSYQASSGSQPEQLVITGHTSFVVGSSTLTVDLGLDGLPGLLVRHGQLYSLNFKVHGTIAIYGLQLGTVDMTVTDDNGIFDLVGSAHLTLGIDIPSSLRILGLDSTYSIDLASFTLTLHDDSGHPHDDTSYTKFNTSILGATVGVRVGFGGAVTVDFGSLVDQAAAATAKAIQDAAVAAAAEAKRLADEAAAEAKKVGRSIKHRLKSLFGEVDGATLYYDPIGNSIVNGVVHFDPSLYSYATSKIGTIDNFQVPDGATGGRLVLFGGIDASTSLPNNIVLTAPFDSIMITPFTTLLDSLIDSKGLEQSVATNVILQVLDLPTTFNITTGAYLYQALSGSDQDAGVTAKEVEITSLVNMVTAALNGLPDAHGQSVSTSALGFDCFSALADAIDVAARQGVTLDLSNKDTILTLINGTAARAGISLTSSTAQANIDGEATVISAVINSIIAIPVAGTSDYVAAICQVQCLAEGSISTQFAQVNAGTASINNVVSAYTGINLTAEINITVIGNCDAPLLQVSNETVEVTGNDPAVLVFTVSVDGTSSPLLPISVTYSTVDQTATVANGDYQQTQGTLTWAPGDTSPKTISVPVYARSPLAASKFFTLELGTAANAGIASKGIGTITFPSLGTTTSLTVSTQPTAPRNTVVLNTTVAIPETVSAQVNGTVTFFDGSTPLATVPLNEQGQAQWSTDLLLPGPHTLTAVYNGSESQGYDLATSSSAPSSLNIGINTQSITMASIPNQVYGVNLPTLLVSASSSSGFPVNYSIVSGPATIDSNGQLTMTGPGHVVVQATQAGDNYTSAATPVTREFDVNKPTLTVTINDTSINYGQDPASLPLTYAISGFLGTDSVASLAALPVLTTAPDGSNVGTYAITGVAGTDPNYNFQFVAGKLTILPAPLNLIVNNQTAVYGSPIPQLTYSLSGLVNSDTIASLTAPPILSTVSSGTGVGDYAISATRVSAQNYSIRTYFGTLSITPAPLTVTANNQTVTYGSPISSLAVLYSGFVNGDTDSSLTALPTVGISDGNNHVGTHTLIAANAIDPNYDITYSSGTLTVNPAALVITANDQTQIIGRSTPSLGVSYAGFVNGESSANLTSLPVVSTTSTGELGSYPITVSGAASSDYQISYQPGTLSVILDSSSVSLSGSIPYLLTGDTPTYTASVQSALDGTTLTTGAVQFQIDGVNQGSPVAIDLNGNASFAAGPLSAGSHVITAVYSGDVNIDGATQTLSQSVARYAATTRFVTPTTQSTYGQSVTYSVSVAPVNAPDGTPAGTVQFAVDGVNFGNPVTVDAHGNASSLPMSLLSAGTHTIQAIYTSNNGFQGGSDLAVLAVQTADQTIDFGSLPTVTNGNSPITLTATASSGLPVTYSVSGPATINGNVLTITGAGIVDIEADQPGDANFNAAQPVQQELTVNAASTTTTLVSSNANSTFGDHVTVTANVAADGLIVDGEVQFQIDGTDEGAPVALSGGSASFDLPSSLGAGLHGINAYFSSTTDFDRSTSETLTQNVDRANATIVITGYDVTYDGQEHVATGSAIGADGSPLSGLVLSGTTHTDAGRTTDLWTFTDTTGNYNSFSGSVNDVIEQATAAITVTPQNTTYNSEAQTASGTATGIGGVDLSSGLVLTGTTHTDVGIYNGDVWSFHDPSGNYADESGAVNDQITQALATINVTPYSTTYNGLAQTASATATGVDDVDLSSDLTLTGTTHTNAGTYNGDHWFFHDPNGNYADASGSVDDAIGKATATIQVTPYNTTYNGTAHRAAATATGAGGVDLSVDLMLSSTSHTEAGTYSGDVWTFLDPSGNYASDSGTVNDVIGQAAANINVTGYSTTYDSTAQTASGTATGVGGLDLSSDLTLTGTTHTNAGTYTGDTWSFHDPSGDYADASGTVIDVIGQATATIYVTPYNMTHDAKAHSATGNAIGIGGVRLKSDLTLTGTSHTSAGTYNGDAWSFHDPSGNYADASGTVNDAIAQANATINVTAYSITYDTAVHTASGSATGVGGVNLSSDLTLSGTAHTNPGIYNGDPWSFHDPAGNYADASGTVNDLISAVPVITTQPVSITVISGSTATFTAAASGTPTPTVQWQVSLDNGVTWNNITGATTATYSFTTTASENNWQFRAAFKNVAGTVTTNAVNLSVATAPAVLVAPTNTTVNEGAQASFTAKASGSPTPAVQWQVSVNNGSTWTNISGATSSTYSFTTAATDNGKQYRAVFTNSVGSATTTPAVLSVIPSSISANVIGVGIKWGTVGSAALFDASGGTLLPNGRTVDIPWANINQISISLNHSVSALNPADVSVSGSVGGNYGPVAVTGSGTSWTITLAKAIANADKVTVVIGNTQLTSYQRILNVLPGDVNDDGLVTSADVTLANNAITLPYNIFADFYGDGVDDSNNLKGIRGKVGTKKIV